MFIFTTDFYDTTADCGDNTVVYAVGDVHGCLEHLRDLLAEMHARAREDILDKKKVIFVFLGDYMDRGPNSIGVVDFLIAKHDDIEKHHFLAGNHDIFISNITKNNSYEDFCLWIQNGGDTVLGELNVRKSISNETIIDFKEAFGEERSDWFCNLETHLVVGNVIFTHAGVDPSIELDFMDSYFNESWTKGGGSPDFAWVRYPFLRFDRNDDEQLVLNNYVICHGHTSTKTTILPYRVSIDTGCFSSGVLTCARFEDGKVSFIQSSTNNHSNRLGLDMNEYDPSNTNAMKELLGKIDFGDFLF